MQECRPFGGQREFPSRSSQSDTGTYISPPVLLPPSHPQVSEASSLQVYQTLEGSVAGAVHSLVASNNECTLFSGGGA